MDKLTSGLFVLFSFFREIASVYTHVYDDL